ncbi:MAG: sel1 repeat family protein [Gammaproteobacteria bacterium]|nr:sel1 repeat family protein [Gammaproteobacteria bacterium]
MARMPTWTILGGGYQSYLKGDYSAAFNEWLPLAELGDVEAQYNLGVMFDEGAGRERDLTAAADWYRKAAEQGFMDAQTNLGIMYYHGQGVARDRAEATKWFQQAANRGDSEAAAYLERIENSPLRATQPDTV